MKITLVHSIEEVLNNAFDGGISLTSKLLISEFVFLCVVKVVY